jgi:hypothetical protein
VKNGYQYYYYLILPPLLGIHHTRKKCFSLNFFPDDLKFQIGEGVDKRARNFHPVIEGGVEGKKPLELLNNGNGSSSSNNVWNNKKKLHA